MAAEYYTKRSALRRLEKGEPIRGVFGISDVELRTTASGDNFVDLKVFDCVGPLDARIWDYQAGDETQFRVGGCIDIKNGEADWWRNKLQIKIKRYKVKQPSKEEQREIIPCSPRDPDELWENLICTLKGTKTVDEQEYGPLGIQDTYLRQLLRAYFHDKDFLSKFKTWPAAKMYHHNYKHGLLEHTTDMVQTASAFCQLPAYRQCNRDIVMVGALLHDTGKLTELSYENGAITTADYGQLLPHCVSGITLLAEKCRSIEGFPPKLYVKLGHIIASHHKELDWGAIVEPKTPEAALVHNIDAADSEGQTYRSLADQYASDPHTSFTYAKRFRASILVNDDNLRIERI